MFVPLAFQVAFINVVSIFWGVYMSYMKNLWRDTDQASHIVEVSSEGIVFEDISTAASASSQLK